jgi:hypothetical protein
MASIDVDVDDILYGMSRYEKQKLIDDLYEEGFVATRDSRLKLVEDEDWNSKVGKLINNKWRLSKEDEEIILNILSKIPE